MKLYNRKSFISNASEGKAVESNKKYITQWLYVLILFFMIGYLVYLIIKPYFYISSRGIVTIEQKEMVVPRSGTIEQMRIQAGQEIHKDSLVAIMGPQKSCLAEEDTRIEKLIYDIKVNKLRIAALIKEKNNLSNELTNQLGIIRALELNASLFKSEQKEQQNAQLDLFKLENEINKLKKQTALMNQRAAQIQALNKDRPLKNDCQSLPLYADAEGIVTEVNSFEQGYLTAGSSLIKYRPIGAKTKVIVLIEDALYQDIITKPKLTVGFPDGSVSFAKVTSVSAASDQPITELLRQKTNMLKVVLEPEVPADLELWNKFENMAVSIGGMK